MSTKTILPIFRKGEIEHGGPIRNAPHPRLSFAVNLVAEPRVTNMPKGSVSFSERVNVCGRKSEQWFILKLNIDQGHLKNFQHRVHSEGREVVSQGNRIGT